MEEGRQKVPYGGKSRYNYPIQRIGGLYSYNEVAALGIRNRSRQKITIMFGLHVCGETNHRIIPVYEDVPLTDAEIKTIDKTVNSWQFYWQEDASRMIADFKQGKRRYMGSLCTRCGKTFTIYPK